MGVERRVHTLHIHVHNVIVGFSHDVPVPAANRRKSVACVNLVTVSKVPSGSLIQTSSPGGAQKKRKREKIIKEVD